MTENASQMLPVDYFVTTHAFTQTVHRDQYPSIDPTSPKLSQEGKTIIVTGASQGLGKDIAIAFAKANAGKIVLASRNGERLEVTKRDLLKVNPRVNVFILSTDTTSEESVNVLEETVKSKIGVPDVLVNAAGLWSSTEIIGETKPKEWWADFEVNLKGSYLMIRAFLRLVGIDRAATIINVGTWGMLMTGPTSTSYAISKLALARLSEGTSQAYPKITSMNFHPGMSRTPMADSHPEVLYFCQDTAELAAGTAVYLATPQAQFLNGRYMSANWDVDELEAKRGEVVQKDLLKIDLKGDFGNLPRPTFTTILYPAESKFDMEYLINTHMPLVVKHWGPYGLHGWDVTQFDGVSGQKSQWIAQLILKWDKRECPDKAMQGPEAKILIDDVPNFTSLPGISMSGEVKGGM